MTKIGTLFYIYLLDPLVNLAALLGYGEAVCSYFQQSSDIQVPCRGDQLVGDSVEYLLQIKGNSDIIVLVLSADETF
jgi:hypothetical protein